MPSRGEIYFADLDPVLGSEQGGIRPVLIIQNDMGNRYSPTVIVAAVTSSWKKNTLPTHIDIGQFSGLSNGATFFWNNLELLTNGGLGIKSACSRAKSWKKSTRLCGLA